MFLYLYLKYIISVLNWYSIWWFQLFTTEKKFECLLIIDDVMLVYKKCNCEWKLILKKCEEKQEDS